MIPFYFDVSHADQIAEKKKKKLRSQVKDKVAYERRNENVKWMRNTCHQSGKLFNLKLWWKQFLLENLAVLLFIIITNQVE